MKNQHVDFGTVEFEGKSYLLTDWAEPSSRLLPYPKNIHEVEEGEEYDFEMTAPAVDGDGNDYRVSWIFSAIKGAECELDSYDYSTPDNVEAR